jgi:uncharacterized oxidoreductase
MRIPAPQLEDLVARVFAAAGCRPPEDRQVARHLVDSNLVGHDSHGVIRVPIYVQWLREGMVRANQRAEVLFENDCLAILDGNLGFGQAIGEQAMDIGIRKAERHGVSVVCIRNCGHLGRIGDWAIQVADAGKLSLHFVNSTGLGNLVPPFGGIDRRLSANPIAAGVPVAGGRPIVLDISTSSIAEGKLKVAFNKGAQVPPGSIIDNEGRPTTDPAVFYGNPPGAILPFGGHKGYGLGIVAEMLAGALAGGGCTAPGVKSLSNGMLSILLDPKFFDRSGGMPQEIDRYVAWVKTSRTVTPDGQILMPGEIEERTKAQRLAAGVELDEKTWSQIAATARELGVEVGA